MPAGRILRSVDKLLMVLGQEHDSLDPAEVLDDLLCLTDDCELKEGLLERLSRLRLWKASALAPPEAASQLEQALEMESKGAGSEAIEPYSNVLATLDETKHGRLATLVRLRLLDLLLDHGTDETRVAALTSALESSSEPDLMNQIWNLSCRSLLSQVSNADAESRRSVWESGLARLGTHQAYVAAGTLEDIDRLVQQVRPLDADFAMEIATDLLLLAPDIPSMQELQHRRAMLLAAQGRWPEFRSAAALEAMLANWTSDGPLGCISECVEIMNSAGLEAEEASAFGDQLIALVSGRQEPLEDSQQARQSSLVDSYLQDAAGKPLREHPHIPARRQAFLRVLSGGVAAAIDTVREVPTSSDANGRSPIRRLEDLVLILSIARHSPSVLAEAVELVAREGATTGASPGLVSRLSDEMIRSRQAKLVRWGVQALGERRYSWTAMLWTSALRLARDESELEPLTCGMVGRGLAACRPKDVAEAISRTIELQDSSRAQVVLLQRVAAIHHAVRDFGAAADALGKAQTLCDQFTPASRTATIKLAKAACLIAQDRWLEALAGLKKGLPEQCKPTQQAAAAFLAGCIRLNRNEVARARELLRAGIEKCPGHPFSPKAQEILDLIDALSSSGVPDTLSMNPQEYATKYLQPVRSKIKDLLEASSLEQEKARFEQRLVVIDGLFQDLTKCIQEQQAKALVSAIPQAMGFPENRPVGTGPYEQTLRLYHESLQDFGAALPCLDLPENQVKLIANLYREFVRSAETFVQHNAGLVTAISEPSQRRMLEAALTLMLLHVPDKDFSETYIANLAEWMRDSLTLQKLSELCLRGQRPLTSMQLEQYRTGYAWDVSDKLAFLEAKARQLENSTDKRVTIAAMAAWVFLADEAQADRSAMTARFELAKVYKEMGHYGLAAEVIQEAMSRYPGSAERGRAAVLRLRYLYSAGRYETLQAEAISYLSDPNCQAYRPQLLYLRWASYRKTGDYTLAEETASKLLSAFSAFSGCADVWLCRAMESLASDDDEEARVALQVILDDYPRSSVAAKAHNLLHKLK